jgi:iron complex transport system ATP-binding protein
MIKAAAGLIPHAGHVRLGNGRRLPGRDVAWMPQRPHLPDEMGVRDYVALGRTPHMGFLSGETHSDRDAVAGALDKLDLVPLAGRPLSTLSGGEAQRAVIARALAQEASVLLLDEPTAGLDVGHSVEVLEVVDQLRRSERLTVVSALHDLTLAGRFADRLALLSGGALIVEGPASEVLREDTLRDHYGAGVRVMPSDEGPVVIPTRQP